MGEGGGSLRGRLTVIIIITKGPAEGAAAVPELAGFGVGAGRGVNRGLRMGSGFLEGEGRVAAEMVVSVGRTHRIRLLNGGRVTVFFTVLHLLSCVSSAQVCH